MPIDFTLSDAQRQLQAGARAFGTQVLSEVAAAIGPFIAQMNASMQRVGSMTRWSKPGS